jgi:uncharacterized protein YndB with AHSA1/START domain
VTATSAPSAPESRVKVKAQVKIARPPAKTFAYLTDFGSWHWWGGGHVSMNKVTPGAPGKGTEVEQVVSRRGRERTIKLEIVELVKDRSLTLAGKDLEAAFRLEPLGAGTRVTCEVAVPASGVSALLYRVVLKRLVAADLRKLRRSVEALRSD